MKRATACMLFAAATQLSAVSEIYSGSPVRKKDKVQADLKLFHPRITPEFLSSFKPTQLDFDMGWVIIDESTRKFPDRITADDLRKSDPARASTEVKRPRITNRGEFLWAEGANDLATSKNSEGLAFVMANDMDRAREIFEELRQSEPQFFPGRFNLGRVYLYFKQHREAIAEFEKCTQLVPQYSKNYYYLGKSYELAARRDAADYNFLRAYKYDIYSLDALVALGDSLLEQKRTVEALNAFKHCLKQDSGFNDALIGMGKVAYTMKKHYDATLWFRTVDTKKSYKKELHFYYGESAFFSQDYQTAARQYEAMLNFPQDAIYSKVSLLRMRKRLEQTKRLLNQTVDQ
ncbi:tetratricopeptide repeat protein [Turneriella parva]|nr:tetratricopeptide repeat protein [Turneriella parva]